MTDLPSFDPGFSTPEMTAVFSAAARASRMLAAEAALARAQASVGMLDADVADRIQSACRNAQLAPGDLSTIGWDIGTPVVPLLDAVRAILSPADRGWLHHGATTQDIVDTASVLQMRDGLQLMADWTHSACVRLGLLADGHRHTPIAGRTFLQPGMATSFGFVAATWMSALASRRDALRRTRRRLPVQLGGPVGDLSAAGARAPDLLEAFAAELELAEPVIAWHSDRAPIEDVIHALQSTCRVVAKIAGDVALLSQTGEVSTRPGRSSSMQAKQNPIDAVRAAAAAEAAIAAGSAITRAKPTELQRGVGAWHAEWWAIPMTFHGASAAVAAIGRSLTSLEVHGETMAANLAAAGLHPSDPAATDLLIDRVLAAAHEKGES